MCKKKQVYVLAIALMAIFFSGGEAFAQLNCYSTCRWDQANDPFTSGGYTIQSGSSVGQEFTPTTSFLDLVEMKMNAQTASSGQAFVRIRSASITGTILGVSDTVSITVSGSPISLRRFSFSQPVPLASSATHVLEVVHTGGVGSLGVFLTGSGGNTYAGGRAIYNGAPIAGDDFWFREGGIIAIEELDQANDSYASGGYTIQSGSSVGQEFTPTTSSLDVVELKMNTQTGSSGQAFVRIRSASITGTILGVSDTVLVTVTGSPLSLRRFSFSQPVPLASSATHVLEVVHTGGVGSLGVMLTGSGGNTYAGGRAIYNGAPIAGDDFWFREGGRIAIEELDQANDSYASGGYTIQSGSSVGQEFTPTTSSLDVVELKMNTQTGSPLSLRRFSFSQPVPLASSATHVLEVVHTGGVGSLGVMLTGSGGNTYAGGRAIYNGAPIAGDDFWFREGGRIAIDALDQANDSYASGGYTIQSGSSVGQEFTPTASSLDVVELKMNTQTGSSGQAFVRIRSASITGTILGVSDTVSVTVTGSPLSLRRFSFSQPVPLASSATHVLEVVHTGGVGSLGVLLTGSGGNTYAGGRAIYNGAPIAGDDFWFREGRTPVDKHCTLTADKYHLSLSVANSQTMTIDAGVVNAGKNYWLFTGFAASGDVPGVVMAPGVVIPLNQPDPLTSFVIGITQLGGGAPTFAGWKSTLDGAGKATPSLNTFGPTPTPLGITLHHAALVYTANGCGVGCDTFQLATNWVPMTTAP